MARTIINKIRMSVADRKQVTADAEAGKPHTLVGRFAGIATGIKSNDHPQYGTSYALTGTFQFQNAATGELIAAPIAWGPEVVITPVRGALESGVQSVQVGPIDIIAKVNSRGDGIVYGVLDYSNIEEDPVSKLMASVPPLAIAAPATQTALTLETPAPAAEEKPAPAAEEKPAKKAK